MGLKKNAEQTAAPWLIEYKSMSVNIVDVINKYDFEMITLADGLVFNYLILIKICSAGNLWNIVRIADFMSESLNPENANIHIGDLNVFNVLNFLIVL